MTTETEVAPKATKPDVFDCKGNKLELNIRVKVTTELDDAGAPKLGTVLNLEYQRKRAVVLLDGAERAIVRPAAKLWVKKTKSGKVEYDTERAAARSRKSAASA